MLAAATLWDIGAERNCAIDSKAVNSPMCANFDFSLARGEKKRSDNFLIKRGDRWGSVHRTVFSLLLSIGVREKKTVNLCVFCRHRRGFRRDELVAKTLLRLLPSISMAEQKKETWRWPTASPGEGEEKWPGGRSSTCSDQRAIKVEC